jgi:hypothetical protein
MSESRFDNQRRNVLKLAVTAVAVVPLSSLLVQRKAWSGELPHLSEDDPTARAWTYVHDANDAPGDKRKEGTFCRNCNLIQSREGQWRPCSIFPGKAVNENGWCAGWVGRG